ncbi:hypothetical protein EGR_10306 [Echinococcus granulosus]|uniref:Uncharacterized protein n=1 Tax=Echinococcus granulosus TaxID=6210 RepID=W6U2Q4_ECHGR|nr:hypothetical protein EGR_10306 [Echinococcus granulosus]EUB54841.1 hypothetical protein EGR_10306 [Echinococcus granulosus]
MATVPAMRRTCVDRQDLGQINSTFYYLRNFVSIMPYLNFSTQMNQILMQTVCMTGYYKHKVLHDLSALILEEVCWNAKVFVLDLCWWYF